MLLYHDTINLNRYLLCNNILYALFSQVVICNPNFKSGFTDLLYLLVSN